MKEEIQFRLGDRVYAPFHGYGVVTAIHEDACVYPIEVTWDDSGLKNMEDVNTFTADGLLSKHFANTDTILTVVEQASLKGEKEMEECINFKVGDKVYYSYHGLGTVIANHNDGRLYPIDVKWDKSPEGNEVSTFTKDGFLLAGLRDCGDNDKLTVVEKVMPAEEEKKARVSSKEEEMAYESKFKVGDRVFYPYFGMGTVIASYKADERTFPIEVQWDHSPTNYPVSTFTKEGLAAVPIIEDADKVKLVLSDSVHNEETGGSEMGQISGAINHNILHKESEKMGAESEKFKVGDYVWSSNREVDAINPAYYRVKGLPEAHDIMTHLMTKEQLEGFYWGNIIKYTYRYGRKGDKAETAGKIAWYATKLKELEECESK